MHFIYTLGFAATWKQVSALTHIDSSELSFREVAGIVPTNNTLKPHHFTWRAPSADDDRAPCPMLNALANHGFLPHNGRNITRDVFVNGLTDALHFDRESVDRLFGGALNAVPKFNATVSYVDMSYYRTDSELSQSFDLGMLHVKNFVEHDGSTSMQDVITVPHTVYHEPTFMNFMSYIPKDADTITIPAAANAKARHFKDMSKINPRFSIVQSQQTPIMLEMASTFLVFGQATQKAAKRSFFEYFFRKSAVFFVIPLLMIDRQPTLTGRARLGPATDGDPFHQSV